MSEPIGHVQEVSISHSSPDTIVYNRRGFARAYPEPTFSTMSLRIQSAYPLPNRFIVDTKLAAVHAEQPKPVTSASGVALAKAAAELRSLTDWPGDRGVVLIVEEMRVPLALARRCAALLEQAALVADWAEERGLVVEVGR